MWLMPNWVDLIANQNIKGTSLSLKTLVAIALHKEERREIVLSIYMPTTMKRRKFLFSLRHNLVFDKEASPLS